jgi:hypothetical protein
MKSMFTRDIANGNVRADMLQEIVGLLQELTEKTPDIYYLARMVDTVIGRMEIFCEYPATCPPDIPIGKCRESKAPAGSTIVSIL